MFRIMLKLPIKGADIYTCSRRSISMRVFTKDFVETIPLKRFMNTGVPHITYLYPITLSLVPFGMYSHAEECPKSLFKRNEYATRSKRQLLEELQQLCDNKVIDKHKRITFCEHLVHFFSNVWKGTVSFVRLIQILIVFSPALLTSPLLFFKKYRQTWYHMFTHLLNQAGPVFIKLGQWAATRPDVLPVQFCLELSRLHDKTDPLSFDVMKPLIETEMNDTIDNLFEYIDPNPIGCGCIAQVYRGKLKHYKDEREVAVKIKKPNVDCAFFRDLLIMEILAHIADYIPFVNRLTPVELADGFYTFLTKQLDLYEEAGNLIHFRRNFDDDDTFVFPEPFIPLCSNNILIETYEEGIPLTEVLQSNVLSKEEEKEIASLGLTGYFHMMLIDNFIHGDMHPGNLLVRMNAKCTKLNSSSFTHSSFFGSLLVPSPNKKDTLLGKVHTWIYSFTRQYIWPHFNKKYHPQLVVLDAGLVTNLEETQKRNFIDLFLALAQGDGYESGRLLIERAPQPAPPVYDPEGYCNKIKNLVDENMEDGVFILSKLKVSETLARMLSYSLYHQVRLDSRFTTLFISVMILEGLGRQLDDQMNMVAQVLPIIRVALPEYEDAVIQALHESPPIRKTMYSLIKNFIFNNHKDPEESKNDLKVSNYSSVLETVTQYVDEEETKTK